MVVFRMRWGWFKSLWRRVRKQEVHQGVKRARPVDKCYEEIEKWRKMSWL